MPVPNVVATALLQCSFGAAPATLSVVPKGPPVLIEGKPAATITDIAPGMNIPPFGMCMSLVNPAVAAATAAAFGVLTPMPCTPVPTAPWSPGAATTLVNKLPALTAGSMCPCAFAGVITITSPMAMKTQSG